MVLSCLATYPSRDMIACATTLPMVPASSGVLHEYAAGKRLGLDGVQVPSVRQLADQGPSLAQDQRLDQETVPVDQVRRSQSAGGLSAARHDHVRAALAVDRAWPGRGVTVPAGAGDLLPRGRPLPAARVATGVLRRHRLCSFSPPRPAWPPTLQGPMPNHFDGCNAGDVLLRGCVPRSSERGGA